MEVSDNISRIIVSVFIATCCVALCGCSEEKQVHNMSDSEKSNSTHGAAQKPAESGKYEKATVAAGCFWGVEAAFRKVDGVIFAQVGYTGGHTENPTYEDVCADKTGHAEAVEVTYDPVQVSYEQLLDVFWRIHDPTTLNRQGPDVGTQYRSAVFYHNKQQESAARASKQQLGQSGRFNKPIVTEIIPAAKFYRAEEYHQQYLEKRGQTSCSAP